MTRRRWLALAAAGGVAAILAASSGDRPVAPEPGARWGVDELRIRRTAEGHLLDLRYRVVDPERARTVLAEDGPAYLQHARTGARLSVPSTPKAGPLRNTGVPRAGRTYFVLFNNPGGVVRRGDRVSVVLGELAAELTVQ